MTNDTEAAKEKDDNHPLVIDPTNGFPHDIDFSGIKYFHTPHWSSKPGDFTWLIWTGETRTTRKHGWFLDDTGRETEKEFDDTKTQAKAMIELQKNPWNENEIWLKFFSVAPEHQGKGFSATMIDKLISFLKTEMNGKTLARSRPSEDGKNRLQENLTRALAKSGIPFTQDSYLSENGSRDEQRKPVFRP